MKPAHIIDCTATECAYNQSEKCHALAITVGGSADHKCDTFCPSSSKGGFPTATGTVGACKVSSCSYNQSMECAAETICLSKEGQEIDCMTYCES